MVLHKTTKISNSNQHFKFELRVEQYPPDIIILSKNNSLDIIKMKNIWLERQ